MQDVFDSDTLDYLILPLVAQQLSTATRALNTVNETNGLVCTHAPGWTCRTQQLTLGSE